jgi:hypothetical protein
VSLSGWGELAEPAFGPLMAEQARRGPKEALAARALAKTKLLRYLQVKSFVRVALSDVRAECPT